MTINLIEEGSPKPSIEDVTEGRAIPVNQVITTIPKCGRCGARHRNAVYREFVAGPLKFDGRIAATHWTICPIMREPILGLLLDGKHL